MVKFCWDSFTIAAAIMFLGAFLISLHQYVFYGKWFEIADVIHHETAIVVMVLLAIVFFAEDR